MNIRWLVILACIGILVGITSVVIYNEKIKTQKPVAVSYNPYKAGIYATGIVESYQPDGSNVNIYPEVSGRVTQVFVSDGEKVKANTPIFAIDDTVQKEVVAKDIAAVKYAQANLINVEQQLQKIQVSYNINPKSISRNTLDNAINSVKIAQQNVYVTMGQYKSDEALWAKYIVRTTTEGIVFRVVVAKGSYTSPQGNYDSYTQSFLPAVQMGVITPYLQVRCYVDEILTPRLPQSKQLLATLFVRGLNNYGIPLQFLSIQPFTIPNIELSDERNERVDVRVLPIIFRFTKPSDINIFPGQLVDIYIKSKP